MAWLLGVFLAGWLVGGDFGRFERWVGWGWLGRWLGVSLHGGLVGGWVGGWVGAWLAGWLGWQGGWAGRVG